MKSLRIPSFALALVLLTNSCDEQEPIAEPPSEPFQSVFRRISETDHANFNELVKEVDPDLSNARQESGSAVETDLGILLLDQTVVRVSDPDQYAPNYTTPLFSLDSEPEASELLSFVSTANGYNGVILSFIPTDGSYDLMHFTGRIEVLDLERELELTTYYENGKVVDSSGGRTSSDDCELTVAYVYDPQWGWHYDIEMVCNIGGGGGSWPEDTGTPVGGNDPYNSDGDGGAGGGSSSGEGGHSGAIGIDEIEPPCQAGHTRDENGDCILLETLTFDIDNDNEEQNPCEWVLAIQYPSEALKIQENATQAHNKTKELFGNYINGNGNNDCADAFRHAYFQILNTRDVGGSIARQFGEAHECDSPNEKESEMDLFNNDVGITLAQFNPHVPESNLIQALLNKLNSGELKILSNLGSFNEVTNQTLVINSESCGD